jgi:hypothetical protein
MIWPASRTIAGGTTSQGGHRTPPTEVEHRQDDITRNEGWITTPRRSGSAGAASPASTRRGRPGCSRGTARQDSNAADALRAFTLGRGRRNRRARLRNRPVKRLAAQAGRPSRAGGQLPCRVSPGASRQHPSPPCTAVVLCCSSLKRRGSSCPIRLASFR